MAQRKASTAAPKKAPTPRTPVKKMRPQMVPSSKTTNNGSPRPRKRR